MRKFHSVSSRANLRRLYGALLQQYGRQYWWPANARSYEARCFEICVGAILTQSTNWKNVERALENLRRARALSLKKFFVMRRSTLARRIRPSGYYNQKALKLRAFAAFVTRRFGGSFRRMFAQPAEALREQLLGVHGIGRETADSMLLYAGNKPVFVIDAYTKRWCAARGITRKGYDEYRAWFESNLPRRVSLYKEFHALIVAWGKDRVQHRGTDA